MSNLSFGTGAAATLFGPGSTTVFKAYGWTMPSDSYFLDGVILRLNAYDTNEAQVSIWSGASTPQTQLIVLNGPAGQGTGDFDYTFTPPAQFTLQANQNYWVYVEAFQGGGDAFLWRATTPSTDPSGIGTNVGYIFNGNPSTTRNALEITGTLVPEPASAALMSAFCAMLVRRRRR
jgi:hypothetical protein